MYGICDGTCMHNKEVVAVHRDDDHHVMTCGWVSAHLPHPVVRILAFTELDAQQLLTQLHRELS